MPDEPDTDVPPTDPDEPDRAVEIKGLRAARGDRLAEQLTEDDRKDPPVE